MTNSIVGQSRARMEQIQKQNESKRMQLEMNRLLQEQLDSHEDRIGNLEDTMRVNDVQEDEVSKAVNRVVIGYLDGRDSKAYQGGSLRGRCYASINREIKSKFGIPRRAALHAKDYEKCLRFISNWILDSDLEDEISSINQN